MRRRPIGPQHVTRRTKVRPTPGPSPEVLELRRLARLERAYADEGPTLEDRVARTLAAEDLDAKADRLDAPRLAAWQAWRPTLLERAGAWLVRRWAR